MAFYECVNRVAVQQDHPRNLNPTLYRTRLLHKILHERSEEALAPAYFTENGISASEPTCVDITRALTPLLDRCFTKFSLCVVLPQRSPPSKSMNAPRDLPLDTVGPFDAMLRMQALRQRQWPALRKPDHCLIAVVTGTVSTLSKS